MGDHGIQRRLAAILAADVAGYTRLMEEDTDGTVAAWTAAREGVIAPTVSAHSGRVVKLTGDGFLVEFPTVQQAVTCAIDMQEKMADSPLKFRMASISAISSTTGATSTAKASISRPAWKRSPTKAESAFPASSTNPFATAPGSRIWARRPSSTFQHRSGFTGLELVMAWKKKSRPWQSP